MNTNELNNEEKDLLNKSWEGVPFGLPLTMSKKEEKAKEYSFNIPSELYNSLETNADKVLWKSDIEMAFEDGWDVAFKETINYLEILMERNSLPLGLQKAIIKELKENV